MRWFGPFMREVCFQLRWELPTWLVWLVSNWWPNNRITIRVRGHLQKPFLKKCGRNLQLASGVRLLNPHEIEIGDDVYLAYNVWLNGLGGLTIEDEVVVGPYVTISTLQHCYKNGSFRFGGARAAPVRLGRGSWLAAHVSVSSGVTIAPGCLVAANAAVTEDTHPGTIVGGVPARFIGYCTEQPATLFSRSGFGSSA